MSRKLSYYTARSQTAFIYSFVSDGSVKNLTFQIKKLESTIKNECTPSSFYYRMMLLVLQ